uniref:Uncharacterized protein n=1 Tax=Siphoviridae sp. ctiJm4 TaxID=2827916 RepID=A0A8S5T2F1_9CAUD|nr:MAG TPA: hypothetical protein [Siphoviridae sp. ctiJm4]
MKKKLKKRKKNGSPIRKKMLYKKTPVNIYSKKLLLLLL